MYNMFIDKYIWIGAQKNNAINNLAECTQYLTFPAIYWMTLVVCSILYTHNIITMPFAYNRFLMQCHVHTFMS